MEGVVEKLQRVGLTEYEAKAYFIGETPCFSYTRFRCYMNFIIIKSFLSLAKYTFK